MNAAVSLLLIFGVVLVLFGAWSIHPGLGMMVLGAIGVSLSYVL